MIVKLTTIVVLFLFCHVSNCQVHRKVILEAQTGNGPFYGVAFSLDLRDMKLYKVPLNGLKKSIVKRFSFQKEKMICEDYLQGIITKEELERLTLIYKNIPFFLAKPSKSYHYLDIYIGEINKNRRIVIVDKNRNNDFRDDTPYFINGDFNLKMKDKKNKKSLKDIPIFEIKYEYDDGFKTTWRKTVVQINPFRTALKYLNPIEDDLSLMIQSYEFKKGTINVNGQKYIIVISNNSISSEYRTEETELLFFKSKDYNRNLKPNYDTIPFKINDKIKLNRTNFLLSKLSLLGDTLYLEEILNSRNIGIRIGDFIDSDLFFDKIGKDKYLLVDFWGTWCAPCIENLPQLEKLYGKLKLSKINLLSVAFNSDSVSAEKIIKKYHMSWLNKLEYSKDKGFVKKLRIESFPTMILISPEGKIIERKIGDKGLVEINKKLEELKLIKDSELNK